jgi:hypothetical protein
MQYRERTRPAESAVIDSVRLIEFLAAGATPMQPDGCWDIAIIRRRDGGVGVLRTGLTTRTVIFPHAPGDEILVVSFKPSAFMPMMPGETMRDRGFMLETHGSARFRIGADVLDIPTFENADVFADRLVRRAVVQNNDLVASVIDGRPKATSERTLQRHFLGTTGLTYKRFTLIQRAQSAVALLREGRPTADVAVSLGYADQAHLTHSLRKIMGQTPGQIARNAAL